MGQFLFRPFFRPRSPPRVLGKRRLGQKRGMCRLGVDAFGKDAGRLFRCGQGVKDIFKVVALGFDLCCGLVGRQPMMFDLRRQAAHTCGYAVQKVLVRYRSRGGETGEAGGISECFQNAHILSV